MRSNSGGDQARDLNRDPTLKENERARGKSGEVVLNTKANSGKIENNRRQRTTGMGSHARKKAQRGDQRIR